MSTANTERPRIDRYRFAVQKWNDCVTPLIFIILQSARESITQHSITCSICDFTYQFDSSGQIQVKPNMWNCLLTVRTLNDSISNAVLILSKRMIHNVRIWIGCTCQKTYSLVHFQWTNLPNNFCVWICKHDDMRMPPRITAWQLRIDFIANNRNEVMSKNRCLSEHLLIYTFFIVRLSSSNALHMCAL